MKPTINQVGHEFLEELCRHHGGCEGSDRDSALDLTSEDSCKSNQLDVVGEGFVAHLLKLFNNDQ